MYCSHYFYAQMGANYFIRNFNVSFQYYPFNFIPLHARNNTHAGFIQNLHVGYQEIMFLIIKELQN